MSARLRFTNAAQVFEAFPTAADDIDTAPGDESPLDFARKLLAGGKRFEAITYAAYLLPRREAVWWGCQCLRAITGNKTDSSLLAAEAWVREPDEEPRQTALALWAAGDRRVASTWLALAAAHSGGNVAPAGARPRPATRHMTAIGVKAAVILAIAQSPPREQQGLIKACVEACLRFAEGGEARVLAPPRPAPKPGAG